ncbi:diadenylate cyclase CdaA [Natranaerofaba carboxydovora]|uniref:diadenylate cyclase CdaA n=1 Tax=Natranaerofaba carboxydovora TaxID=2742683 RepID=UPI001F13EF5F|nr:diadenylate cyclase CdaA [Natranaerofaba carboxydovora]UMZ75434.1 Cyclic di-AMP synthase CdaA [Natranaerofaba carboxydovora]
MNELVQEFFAQFSWRDLIDLLIVAFLFYKIVMIIRGTRAVQLLKGLLVLVVAMVVSDWLGFRAINWLLTQLITVGVIAIPIVFQPELRRALEKLGRGQFFTDTFSITSSKEKHGEVITEIVKTCSVLKKRGLGGLIVIERKTGLRDFVETGIMIDGKISAEFLINIFMPRSPLHDGAVVIKDDVVRAAGCYLPLTEKEGLSKDLGTRHRAAIGITEHSDAISIVVSEENGKISISVNGKIIRDIKEQDLEKKLKELWEPGESSFVNLWHWKFGNG